MVEADIETEAVGIGTLVRNGPVQWREEGDMWTVDTLFEQLALAMGNTSSQDLKADRMIIPGGGRDYNI